MRKFVFDSHKLAYHPERVAEFLQTGDCFPLYMEISPVGRCNHRCVFCAYDYLGYPNRSLDTRRTLHLINELAECGIKSVLFAGEGEPLLHPDIDKFIRHTRDCGVDVGLFTNGHLLTPEMAERILDALTFIRFSMNAGSPENYAQIHQVSLDAFVRVLANIEHAVHLKHARHLGVDIGVQFVLLPENIATVRAAAEQVREAGVDYFTVKPFVQQNDAQAYHMDTAFRPESLEETFDSLEELQDDNFNVVIRRQAFQGYGDRTYCRCLGTSFISVLNSAGDVASCLPYWERPDFVYGNIYEESFEEIWRGPRRARIRQVLEEELDARTQCPPNCRPHAINGYLAELKQPTAKHVNFV